MKNRSSVLRKTYPFLRIVSTLSPNSRRKILNELNGDQDVYKSMREIAINTVKGNVPLSTKSKQQLKKFDKTIHLLNKHRTKSCSCRKRKQIIQQGSGILPILIPAIAGIISSIISKND